MSAANDFDLNVRLVISTEHNGLTIPLNATQQVRGGRLSSRSASRLPEKQRGKVKTMTAKSANLAKAWG
jgi:hypothetical protein